MAVCVPALAIGQTDSVQSSQEVSTGPTSDTAVPGAIGDSARSAAPAPQREARMDGREVVGRKGLAGTGSILVGRRELEGASTLVDVLSRVPGVEVRRMGGVGGYSEITMRNCPSQQVRVVVDGVAWKDQGASTVDLGRFATDGLESVEVVQGASEGGVGRPELRIRTRAAWLKRGFALGAGGFGEREASAWWSDRDGIWSVVGWYQTASNDWPIRWDRGTVYNKADDTTVHLENNDFATWGGSVAFRPNQELSISARLDRDEKGGTGLYVADPSARWKVVRMQADVSSDPDGPATRPWRLGASWSGSEWSDSGSSLDYRSNRDASERGWAGYGEWAIRRERKDWLDGRLAVFARGESESWSTTTPKQIHVTPDATRYSGGASVSWTGTDKDGIWGAGVSASGKVAWDKGALRSSGMADPHVAVDSSWLRPAGDAAASVWVLPGSGAWKGWLGLGYSDRLPDFHELYGDNGLVFASSGLDPERTLSVELGSAVAFGVLHLRGTTWWARYWNPIRRKMIGASSVSRYENDSAYSAAGVDATCHLEGRWGTFQAGLGASRTWIESEYAAMAGNEMERNPDLRWNVRLGSPRWLNLSVYAAVDAVGPSWASPLNRPDDLIEGHELWNAGVDWNFRGVKVSLQGLNLGDVQFEEFERAPQSGRSWHLRIGYEFRTNEREER